ncbi:MAG: hypothetical protein KatS3mg009_1567 [Acidimicrobiia bacterium]|jgi:hypothetical protein|nr:MAG: hypothetical protein KatS3mg009_1567 [Acidimicrobiia bacterium]
MNVIEFLEYLAAHDATRALAYDLADAWVASEAGLGAIRPAA